VIVNQSNTIVWRWDNTHAFGANPSVENPMDATQVFEYNLRFPGQCKKLTIVCGIDGGRRCFTDPFCNYNQTVSIRFQICILHVIRNYF
ncbi:MAG: hypothetical protein KGN35_09435, partial [Betaproteobacteria bacterium]|nr:hypothetical protein [Betaproteobacteria bacterium]